MFLSAIVCTLNQQGRQHLKFKGSSNQIGRQIEKFNMISKDLIVIIKS